MALKYQGYNSFRTATVSDMGPCIDSTWKLKDLLRVEHSIAQGRSFTIHKDNTRSHIAPIGPSHVCMSL